MFHDWLSYHGNWLSSHWDCLRWRLYWLMHYWCWWFRLRYRFRLDLLNMNHRFLIPAHSHWARSTEEATAHNRKNDAKHQNRNEYSSDSSTIGLAATIGAVRVTIPARPTIGFSAQCTTGASVHLTGVASAARRSSRCKCPRGSRAIAELPTGGGTVGIGSPFNLFPCLQVHIENSGRTASPARVGD